MRRGIVREVPAAVGGVRRYDFTHGRLRDVAFEVASLARRRLLHRRTAEALRLEPAGAGRDELARFARIAGHEREAGRPAEAAAAFIEAADRAEGIFANREAIEHLEAALALGAADPAASARPDRGAAVAHSANTRPRSPRSRPRPRSPDPMRCPRSRSPSAGCTGGEATSRRPRAISGRPLPRPACRRRRGPGRSSSASVVALRAGDLAMAGAAAAEALASAARADDPHLSGVAERLIGLVARARGDLGSARAALQRSLTLAARRPRPDRVDRGEDGACPGPGRGRVGGRGRGHGDGAIDACRRIGDRHLEAAVENHLADMLHDAGRADESMVHLKRAVALFAEIGEGAPERDPGIWSLAAW